MVGYEQSKPPTPPPGRAQMRIVTRTDVRPGNAVLRSVRTPITKVYTP